MEPHTGVITNPKFRMWLRSDGIVHVVWLPGTEADVNDAIASFEAMAQLTGGRRSPLLVDMREIGPHDRATRAEWARHLDLVTAVALVVGTPLSRMMGNLSINMKRPTTPLQLFDDDASALAWLRASER